MNGKPVELLAGMRVRHALIQLGLLGGGKGVPPRIKDRWGNLVGLDGALEEGDEIFFAGEQQDEPLSGPCPEARKK